MSTYDIHVPSPDEINYHEAAQTQRVQAALKRIDPGDVLAVIDDQISGEPDPTAHSLYHMVCWLLDRQLTPLDGGQLYDRCRSLCISAIDRCVTEALARGDD